MRYTPSNFTMRASIAKLTSVGLLLASVIVAAPARAEDQAPMPTNMADPMAFLYNFDFMVTAASTAATAMGDYQHARVLAAQTKQVYQAVVKLHQMESPYAANLELDDARTKWQNAEHMVIQQFYTNKKYQADREFWQFRIDRGLTNDMPTATQITNLKPIVDRSFAALCQIAFRRMMIARNNYNQQAKWFATESTDLYGLSLGGADAFDRYAKMSEAMYAAQARVPAFRLCVKSGITPKDIDGNPASDADIALTEGVDALNLPPMPNLNLKH